MARCALKAGRAPMGHSVPVLDDIRWERCLGLANTANIAFLFRLLSLTCTTISGAV